MAARRQVAWPPMAAGISRRTFLQAGGSLGLLALVPPVRVRRLLAAAPGPGQRGRFLSAHELDTLRAVTARLVPGPPDDPDPGALEAKAAEAIDLLLGAFSVSPPMIHAGGPFSGRFGGGHDDFADFVRLDPHAQLGWRMRLEGSAGKPEREFAGPVRGLQQIYREGLAHLDDRAGGDFASLPSPAQDLLLQDQSDSDLQDFLTLAFEHCIEFMYGAPEYGGNQGLASWRYTNWPGDTQPRGFTPDQVENADSDASTHKPDAALLARFAPHLAGTRASRDKWWLRRKGLLTK